MAKHQSLAARKISDIRGLCAGTRTLQGRFGEEQSRMNWVKIGGGTSGERVPDMGCTCDTVFIRSGNSRFLTSESARHNTNACSVGSVMEAVQRLHAKLDVELLAELSVSLIWIRSQVRCKRSFLQSCVVSMFCNAGCGRPDKPLRLTFRNLIFELFCDRHLRFFSCQVVILVFTNVSHCDLVHAGVCRRARGGGSPYF